MRTPISLCIQVLALCFLLTFLSVPGMARDPAIESIGNYGTIDWVKQRVSAIGIGVPPRTAQNLAQAKAMSRRAAIVTARRNLLEVIKGVHIDSRTRVEKFIVTDDTVQARINGELKLSSVDEVRHFGDGTAEARVSMPIEGTLREILISASAGASLSSPGPSMPTDMQQRIRSLEDRVRRLEQQIGLMQQTGMDREEMHRMFQGFATTVMLYLDLTAAPVPIEYEDKADMDALRKEIAGLTSRFREMDRRISALESGTASDPVSRKSLARVPYTGLVIDARGSGFRPCLKPEIYGKDSQVYPGDYISLKQAVMTGYVRYYRSLSGAQQSARAGALPLTIRSDQTYSGARSLQISETDFAKLLEIGRIPGSFLSKCNVIIVF